MSKAITIAGPKGGTGKSITAVNLASSLALLGKTTLLVDCDPQGCSTRWCGLENSEDQADIATVLSGQCDIENAVTDTRIGNLKVLPAEFRLFKAALRLGKNPGNEKILRLFIDGIRSEYEYIIIDSPSSYSFMSISAMTAADSLVVCLNPGESSYEDVHSLLLMVRHIRLTHKIPLKIAGVAFNRCAERKTGLLFLDNHDLSDIRQMVYDTVIPDDPKIQESVKSMVPCALHDVKSPAAQAFIKLAREVHSSFKQRGVI